MLNDPFNLFDDNVAVLEAPVQAVPSVQDASEVKDTEASTAPAVLLPTREEIIAVQTESAALQSLTAGVQFVAGDGEKFIRTNKLGTLNIQFCNTVSGELCSAFDIIKNHGGLAALTDSSPF